MASYKTSGILGKHSNGTQGAQGTERNEYAHSRIHANEFQADDTRTIQRTEFCEWC